MKLSPEFERQKTPWYVPSRDGDFSQYIANRVEKDHYGIYPLFKGPEWYDKLWNEGYFLPNQSVIRIMWNVGRMDEHFVVIDGTSIRGMHTLPGHPGKEGTYNVREIITPNSPCWEAQCLAPHFGKEPKRR